MSYGLSRVESLRCVASGERALRLAVHHAGPGAGQAGRTRIDLDRPRSVASSLRSFPSLPFHVDPCPFLYLLSPNLTHPLSPLYPPFPSSGPQPTHTPTSHTFPPGPPHVVEALSFGKLTASPLSSPPNRPLPSPPRENVRRYQRCSRRRLFQQASALALASRRPGRQAPEPRRGRGRR